MKIAVAKQAKSEIRHIFAASWPRQGSLQRLASKLARRHWLRPARDDFSEKRVKMHNICG
jgi:hypothetical protein